MIRKKELMEMSVWPLDELCRAADQLRQEACGNGFDICTITNGKSGKCTEDCKYCAQSANYTTQIEEYPLKDIEEISREAGYNREKGILRFSIVTSGRTLTEEEVETLCEAYRNIEGISLCASHGLLNRQQFEKLKEAGVSRYHNNLETSRRFFPRICTTHTYDDKIAAIERARKAGLSVCSGGILGLGETREDRIDLALELQELEITSVPINILNPIPGTPLENQKMLSYDQVCRAVALFRMALPKASIRLAGGRGLLEDKGRRAFCTGANAAISGDMLTTGGISIEADMEMIRELGYKVVKCND